MNLAQRRVSACSCVDDDPGVAEVIGLLLEREGYAAEARRR